MVDLQIVKDALNPFELDDVALVRSRLDISDDSAKLNVNSAVMEELNTASIFHPFEQWADGSKNDNFLAKEMGKVSVLIVYKS